MTSSSSSSSPAPRQAPYLRFLTWNTRLHIALVVAIVGAVVSPFGEEAIPVVLFAGMLLRATTCGLLPRPSALRGSATVLLFPLWPVLITHDVIWSWMEREGFGEVFRRVVAAVLLAAIWFAVLPHVSPWHSGMVLGSAIAASQLRRSDTVWYVVAGSVPLLLSIGTWPW